MNMNENENNFEMLRRLLKLKRHETPPPGFFDGFSGQVIARLNAGEGSLRQTADDAYFSEAPWLLKLLQAFELKPAFAGAFAGALGLLLVFGIVYANRPDSSSQALLQTSGQSFGSIAAMTTAPLPQTSDSAGIIADTNPAASLQPVASLFDSQNPLVQPVSFSPSGN
jgi:hypothetical protein